MDLRTKICIWVILVGLGNFLAYSIFYMFIGGEAMNGPIIHAAGGGLTYFLKTAHQQDMAVPKWLYVYSGVHSISIWPTVGAIMLAMLTLARERIVSSMRATIVRGRTFITALGTLIAFITIIVTIWSSLQFSSRFAAPELLTGPEIKAASRP